MNSLADKTMSVVTSVPKEQRNFIWKIENFEELVNFVIHKDESTIVKLPFNMVLTSLNLLMFKISSIYK